MAKLHKIVENYYAFHCPGCGYDHSVTVNGKLNSQGATWGWNGNVDLPTFTPSVLCNVDSAPNRCHSFVRDGKIEFLQDCFHSLKGQTVEIPEYEE